IPVPGITPRKRAVMEPTGSSQRKDLCSISMFTRDEDSGLGMDTNQIPIPTITPEKWIAMEPTNSWQTKSLCSINTSTLDEDSGLGMNIDQTRRPLEKCLQTLNARRCLFNIKRSLDLTKNISSESKRYRDNGFSPMPTSWKSPVNLFPSSDPMFAIIDAVNSMTFESDLIADGSSTYCLPTVPSKQKDLKCITTDTYAQIRSIEFTFSFLDVMATVLKGDYSGIIRNCTIIDCRYPYEFEGGHIKGAVNLFTKEMMQQFLLQSLGQTYDSQRRVLIFHCEFSLERGPTIDLYFEYGLRHCQSRTPNRYRFLREEDRILNKDKYPHLCYPEVYLLEGGYRAFYENHKNYCEPKDYKPMLHKDHSAELHNFKTKSKSCTARDKRQGRRRHKLVF
ncbi:hypothetical protein CHS0354_031099, partial [Potamilus streckersoni]